MKKGEVTNPGEALNKWDLRGIRKKLDLPALGPKLGPRSATSSRVNAQTASTKVSTIKEQASAAGAVEMVAPTNPIDIPKLEATSPLQQEGTQAEKLPHEMEVVSLSSSISSSTSLNSEHASEAERSYPSLTKLLGDFSRQSALRSLPTSPERPVSISKRGSFQELSPRREALEQYHHLLNEHYQKVVALIGHEPILNFLQAKHERLEPQEQDVLDKFYAQVPRIEGKSIQEVLRFTILLAVSLPQGKGGHPTFIAAMEYHEFTFTLEKALAQFLLQSIRAYEEGISKAKREVESMQVQLMSHSATLEQLQQQQTKQALKHQTSLQQLEISAQEKQIALEKIVAELTSEITRIKSDHARELETIKQACEQRIKEIQTEVFEAQKQYREEMMSIVQQRTEALKQQHFGEFAQVVTQSEEASLVLQSRAIDARVKVEALNLILVYLQENLAAVMVEQADALVKQAALAEENTMIKAQLAECSQQLSQSQREIDQLETTMQALQASLDQGLSQLTQAEKSVKSMQVSQRAAILLAKQQQAGVEQELKQIQDDWTTLIKRKDGIQKQLELLVAGFCGLHARFPEVLLYERYDNVLTRALTSLSDLIGAKICFAEAKLAEFQTVVACNAQESAQTSFPEKIMQWHKNEVRNAIAEVNKHISESMQGFSLTQCMEKLTKEKLASSIEEKRREKEKEAAAKKCEGVLKAKNSIKARLDDFIKAAGLQSDGVTGCFWRMLSFFDNENKAELVKIINKIKQTLEGASVNGERLCRLFLALDQKAQQHGLMEVLDQSLFKESLSIVQSYRAVEVALPTIPLREAMQQLSVDFSKIWALMKQARPVGEDIQSRNFYALRMQQGILR
jgi:hypothetical protein